VNGEKIFRVSRIRLDLPAQSCNIYIDDAGRRYDIESPYLAQNFGTGDGYPSVLIALGPSMAADGGSIVLR
jgi:hypothetical protein